MLFANQTSAAIDNARLFKSLKDDLIERKSLSEELQISEQRFKTLIRSVHDVIAIISPSGRFQFISQATNAAWGIAPERLTGRRLPDIVHPEDTRKVRDMLSSLKHDGDDGTIPQLRVKYDEDDWKEFEVTFVNLNNDPVIGGVVCTFHDVTERHTYEHRLKNMAYHDALTGLPNRKYYEERLAKALEKARENGRLLAVVFMDLDSFKLINDTLGHQWGDRLLCMVSDRLQACLRHEDFAARMGGDEFTLLLEGITSPDQVPPILQRFVNAFTEPFTLDRRDMFISGSFGAMIGGADDHPIDLLRKADMAMFQAKRRGKGVFEIYHSNEGPANLEVEASDQMLMQSDLQRALSRGEFRAGYTPIYKLDGLREMALESQLNWMHPRRGRLLLTDFLAAAYRSGVMASGGQWLQGEVIRQAGVWNRRGRVPVYLRVPAKFILNGDFASWISRLTDEAKLDRGLVTLDVISDETTSQPEGVIGRLTVLKNTGFRLAISNFGTNFSGISLLTRLPVDHIRMDVSLFRSMDDKKVEGILTGTRIMADAFGIDVIVEGIESREQAEQVRSYGYRVGLGPGLSGPLLAGEVEERRLFGL